MYICFLEKGAKKGFDSRRLFLVLIIFVNVILRIIYIIIRNIYVIIRNIYVVIRNIKKKNHI